MAVVGGTASVLGGGKFANGAMSGAFVHLFNGEFASYIQFALKAKKMYGTGSHVYTGLEKVQVETELALIHKETNENYYRWFKSLPNNYPKYIEAVELGNKIDTFWNYRRHYFAANGIILSDSQIERIIYK